MTTMYEHVGGEQALLRFAEHFHTSIQQDPLVGPLFLAGSPDHAEHLAAFFCEMLGGPSRYSDELGGFLSLMKAHLGMRITEEQSERFVQRMLASADAVGLPDDERFRTAFAAQIEKAAGFTRKVSLEDDSPMLDAPHPELGRWKW
ncbi:group II truncated hemoglobin [Streptomyces sp. NPDC002506]|uniref:group II truncated hemoglobin n=1 Tax=Streptomyces sp. NPDC002506 TaxID=3154536 RepID=UPI00331A6F8E